MSRTKRIATIGACAVALAWVALPAGATSFPVSGGSYVANVVYRLDETGAVIQSVAGSVDGGAYSQQGAPENVADYAPQWWQVGGFGSSTATATATITLDQAHRLNKIHTEYGFYRPSEYEVRVWNSSTGWTTVVPRKAVGGFSLTDTFAAADAEVIEWQVWGGGPDGAYAAMQELVAFVDAGAPGAPQIEEGYNVLPIATVYSQSGWQSWGPFSSAKDNDLRNDGATPAQANATGIFDLGDSYWLYAARTGMYASWDYGKLEISDDLSAWTTIYEGALTTNTWTFGPQEARYVRVTGTSGAGNGHMRQLEVFATTEPPPPVEIPEPASAALLVSGIAGLALRRRKR